MYIFGVQFGGPYIKTMGHIGNYEILAPHIITPVLLGPVVVFCMGLQSYVHLPGITCKVTVGV